MRQNETVGQIIFFGFFDYHQELSKYQTLNSTEQKVLNELTNLIKGRKAEVDSIQKDLYNFFSDKFYKYWKMTLKTIGSKGNEYIEKYMIYPYDLIREINIFAVYIQVILVIQVSIQVE